jgi:hypothetical protein
MGITARCVAAGAPAISPKSMPIDIGTPRHDAPTSVDSGRSIISSSTTPHAMWPLPHAALEELGNSQRAGGLCTEPRGADEWSRSEIVDAMHDFFNSHVFAADSVSTSGDVHSLNTLAGAAAGDGATGCRHFGGASADTMTQQSAAIDTRPVRARTGASRTRSVLIQQLDLEAMVAKQAAAAGFRRCVARGIFAAWRPFAASRRAVRRCELRRARDQFAAALFAVWRNVRAARCSRDALRALTMLAGDGAAAAAPLVRVQLGLLAVPVLESQLHLPPTSRASCFPPLALTWSARRQRILYLGAAFACNKGRRRRF